MKALDLLRNVPVPPGQAVGMSLDFLLSYLLPVRLPGPSRGNRIVGFALTIAGCAITVWAVAERKRRESGPFDLENPQALVTTGPYALSRHPMYVGWWLIHLGLGIARSSAWVVATLPVAVVAEHRTVHEEERSLAQAFGDQYAGYAEGTPRYLPGIH